MSEETTPPANSRGEKPSINAQTTGNNSPAIGRVEGNFTYNAGLNREELVSAVQEAMRREKEKHGPEYAKEFPMGYALFTLSGETKQVIPFQDGYGRIVVVDWNPAGFVIDKNKIILTLPDILICNVSFGNVSISINRRVGSYTEIAIDMTDGVGLHFRRVHITSPDRRFIISGHVDSNKHDPYLVLAARVVRSDQYGEVILLGIKREGRDVPSLFQSDNLPTLIPDGRTMIGPFMRGEPTHLIQQCDEMWAQHTAGNHTEAFDIATRCVDFLELGIQMQRFATSNYLTTVQCAYVYWMASVCATSARKHDFSLQWARMALAHVDDMDRQIALVCALRNNNLIDEEAKFVAKIMAGPTEYAKEFKQRLDALIEVD